MPPVLDRARRLFKGPLDQALAFAQDLRFGGHDQPFGMNPQTVLGRLANDAGTLNRLGSKLIRPALYDASIACPAVSGRDALVMLEKSVNGRGQRHQARRLSGPDIRNAARQCAVQRLLAKLQTARF